MISFSPRLWRFCVFPSSCASQKRRSTRLDHAVPVAVQGVGAYREPYQDQVSTLSISCTAVHTTRKYEVIQVRLSIWTSDPPMTLRARLQQGAREMGAKSRRQGGFPGCGGAGSRRQYLGDRVPPEDWFPVHALATSEAAATGRELRVVARAEQQNSSALQAQPGQASSGLQVHPAPGSPTPAVVVAQGSQLKRNEAPASPLSSLTQLMAGLANRCKS